jgi:DNA-binding PadR family transcriptional regulator
VRNERKVLAAALRLLFDGTSELHGYELFARLVAWEGEPPMNHGTLYRCLRSLEARSLLDSTIDQSSRHLRVNFSLTPAGIEAARLATLDLAGSVKPERWLDPGLATRALPTSG